MQTRKPQIATLLITAAMGSLMTSAASAATAEQAFSFKPLAHGYQLAQADMQTEHKTGEGKCGEGKCGGDKAKAKHQEGKCGGDKMAEGKCGGKEKAAEGKCGGHGATDGKAGEGKCGGDKKAPAEG
jgi:uncharacterized low-complexity protein